MEEQVARESLDVAGTLRVFLGVLEKRKWFALGVLIATLGATFLLTSRQVPIYRATATLIIDRRSPTVLSRVQEVIELGSSDYWSIKEYMQTQYEILKSRRLAKRVVDKLTLGLDERFMGVPVNAGLSEGEKRTLMAEKDPVAVLLSKVSVESKPDSQMALVSVEDPDPHMAQELSNALATEYKEENLEYKKRVVTEAITELRNMLTRLKQDMESAEARAQEFERRHSMVSLESRKAQVMDRLKLLNDRYVLASVSRAEVETSSTREELKSRIAEIDKLLEEGDFLNAAHPRLMASANITGLKMRLVEMDTEIRGSKYLEKHPVTQAMAGQRALVYKALKNEARTLLQSERTTLAFKLQEEENRLTNTIRMEEEIRKQLESAKEAEGALAKAQLDYAPLLKKAQETRKMYEEIKARYSETTLSAQVETNNVRIQDLAVEPKAPVRPNKQLNLLVGLVIGLLLGIGAAYLIESLDSSLKTREDIESVGQVNFLGLIPAVEESDQVSEEGQAAPELYVHHQPRSSIAEHFRTVKTNLFFSKPSAKPKRILVTSPGPREGKTTVGMNLAAVAAATGSRTLVIDTDMRRPRIHRLMGMPRRPGIAEYYMGNQQAKRFVRGTVVPGLDVLTCGALFPNPVEIIESRKFWDMVEELSNEYEIVIFDSPPLLAVADAKIVCSMADAVLLVVRAGTTTKEELREALSMLSPVLNDDVGVVLNGFDVEKHSYRYYYYRSKTYRYYRYYSYGEQGEEGATATPEQGNRSEKWEERSA